MTPGRRGRAGSREGRPGRPPTARPPDAPGAGAGMVRRLGLSCILVAACARAVTTYDPHPGWGLDPLTTVAPQNGVGPATVMLLSVLSLLGLALVLAAAWRARERVPALLLALAGIGLIPAIRHGWLGPGASVENAAAGAAWAGAIGGALGACIACRHPGDRALVFACCAGLAGPLAIRGAVQVYVEHPVLVEEFNANRGRFLASHGWAPGSAMARSFERRLTQPDASAWFAMSNVYASVMAGCVAVFGAACAGAARARLWATGDRHDRYRLAGVALGLVCAVGGLFVAIPAGGEVSKGAAGAMLLGLALVALALAVRRAGLSAGLRRLLVRLAPLLGPGLVAMALLAVLLRGLVGERIGELSLLFRYFYAQAALRIFEHHPLWGVGPDGFQAAYLLAKNPLNPEEVASPHSVMLDYLSTLGVFGLAWCGVLLGLASRAGGALLGPGVPGVPARRDAGPPVRWLVAIVLVCIGASLAYETIPLARATPSAFGLVVLDGSVRLALAALLWLGLSAALLTLPDPEARASASPGETCVPGPSVLAVGLGAGALAVLTHAQIELTATDIASCGWFFVLLGCAAARPEREPSRGRLARLTAPVGAGACAALVAAGVVATLPVRAWQAELRAASALAGEPTAFVQRANALSAGGGDGDTTSALFADLERVVGHPISPTARAFNDTLNDLRLARTAEAAGRLDALARDPSTPSRSISDSAIELRMSLTALDAQLGLDPAPAAGAALDLARWATARWAGDTGLWRDLAQATRQAGELSPQLVPADPSDAELEPLTRAAELDPYSPQIAAELAFRLADHGRAALAREWASRALANHEWRRLDPLAGLSENQVQRLRELVGNP